MRESTLGRRRRLLRRFRFGVAAVGLAVALVFSVAVWPLPFLPRSGPDAAASEILRRAATAAQNAPAALGRYRYTKSVGGWLVLTNDYTLLRPVTREIWIAPDGSGRLSETVGAPVFFTARDRANWVAAGSPYSQGQTGNFGPGGLYYAANSDLPTNPVLLRAMLFAQALGKGWSVNEEMFVLVGDSLRETVPDAPLRAALFEVASTIEGVQALGSMTDASGRPGIGIGLTDGPAGYRMQRILIFDPTSYQFLGEEERVVETTADGIPAGSVIGYASYITSGAVDQLP